MAEEQHLIPAEQYCAGHHIETSFIDLLLDHGLIEIVSKEDRVFIHEDQLASLEKITYLHYDLEINLEGVETIMHLLRQVEEIKNEMKMMENRLHFYEEPKDFNDVL